MVLLNSFILKVRATTPRREPHREQPEGEAAVRPAHELAQVREVGGALLVAQPLRQPRDTHARDGGPPAGSSSAAPQAWNVMRRRSQCTY